jgi:hypothetical protein
MSGNLDSLIDSYIAALPITPIAIIGSPDRRLSKLGIMRTAEAFDALWFPKNHHAELVAMTCLADFETIGALRPDGFVDLHVNTVRDFVIDAAATLGASWRTDAEVRHDASFQVEKIIMHVEVGRRTGQLTEVNQSYKAQRLAAKDAGRKMCSYASHLAAFTRSLVMMAAQNSPG